MKTFLLITIFMLGFGFAEAQEKAHTKHSNLSKNKIVYSEKKYKPSFTRKKQTKKYMWAGENMHRDRLR